LLSDKNQQEAADEVEEKVYPVKECLIEVKKKKNRLAEAVLYKRRGENEDYIDSIKIYLEILEDPSQISILKIIAQMHQMQPDIFRTQDEIWTFNSSKNFSEMK
jgi:hypothetical protein